MWNQYTNTSKIVKTLQKYFSMFGKPLWFKSDGRSQFTSKEMKRTLEEYEIEHAQISQYKPQSNGRQSRK